MPTGGGALGMRGAESELSSTFATIVLCQAKRSWGLFDAMPGRATVEEPVIVPDGIATGRDSGHVGVRPVGEAVSGGGSVLLLAV